VERSKTSTLTFNVKYKTSQGVPWGEVTLAELRGMVQDGIEAAALLKAARDMNQED
jgi:hypothetical protein